MKIQRNRPYYSYTGTVSKLQQSIVDLQSQAEQLRIVNERLLAREQLLFTTLAEQGDFLHDVATILAQQCSDDAVADSLLNSLQHLQELQQGLGSSSSSPAPADELYTSRCLRAAITLEAIAWARKATVSDVAVLVRSRVMRLSYLLEAGSKTALLTDNLEKAVDAGVQLHMLLFAAADHLVPQLTVLNLDSMVQEAPPEGHFQEVVGGLGLQPEQLQVLRDGFSLYIDQRTALGAKLQPLVKQIKELLQPPTATAPATAVSESQASSSSKGSSGTNATANSNTSTGSNASSSAAVNARQWKQLGLPAAALDLETAEVLEQLLVKWGRCLEQIRLSSCNLIFLWINTLDTRQHALAAVLSYPFNPRPVELCECISRM